MAFDHTFKANTARMNAEPEQEFCLVEFITTEGEHVAIVVTGETLVGMKGQIEELLTAHPEIRQWTGRKAH